MKLYQLFFFYSLITEFRNWQKGKLIESTTARLRLLTDFIRVQFFSITGLCLLLHSLYSLISVVAPNISGLMNVQN